MKERRPEADGGESIMKLSRASSYALHAVAHMAGMKTDGPVASHLIAQERGIPERFLLKVLKPLVTARVLFSIKGPNGGYRLARSPSDITVLEIIEAVDGPIRGMAPLTDEKGGSPLDTKLEAVCEESAALVRKQLGAVKLSELASKR